MEIGILGSVVGKFAFDGRSVALVESCGLSEQGWHHLFHVVCHMYIKNIRAYIAHGSWVMGVYFCALRILRITSMSTKYMYSYIQL